MYYNTNVQKIKDSYEKTLSTLLLFINVNIIDSAYVTIKDGIVN